MISPYIPALNNRSTYGIRNTLSANKANSTQQIKNQISIPISTLPHVSHLCIFISSFENTSDSLSNVGRKYRILCPIWQLFSHFEKLYPLDLHDIPETGTCHPLKRHFFFGSYFPFPSPAFPISLFPHLLPFLPLSRWIASLMPVLNILDTLSYLGYSRGSILGYCVSGRPQKTVSKTTIYFGPFLMYLNKTLDKCTFIVYIINRKKR